MTNLDPTCCLSAEPGADGVLISRREMRRWLAQVEATTNRLRVRALGTSTEGRPIDAVLIADDLAGDRTERLLARRRDAAGALSRGQSAPGWDRPVVLITSGIHATEVGGPQSIPGLIHWLTYDESPEVRAIRERVLTIIVPTLNPDGMDLVQRWHEHTLGTPQAGSLPPLLYHRHAGHDNNRDWIFRNLRETRVVLDGLHRPLLPHVTLDQHQMNPQGPRFALPPYADPWEPHIHPRIVAATSGLGQAVATDLTLAGLAGVTTGRYFDAWEPSRAIQHYRGGVRILAEAANANLAHPIEISPEQLAAPPLSQAPLPTTATPLPWPGGTWRLHDIVAYHLAAAKSLLLHIARDPARWVELQWHVLEDTLTTGVTIHVPRQRPGLDIAANRRLAAILDDADLAGEAIAGESITISTGQPFGRLTAALLLPAPFPADRGPTSYDLTTHHLPLIVGAVVTAGSHPAEAESEPGPGRWLVVDARSHRVPELVETAAATGGDRALRLPRRAIAGSTLLEPGTWLIDRDSIPEPLHPLAHDAIEATPASASRLERRDLLLLSVGDQPTADHGWTRWWLEARRMPYLEADSDILPAQAEVARTITMLIADTPVAAMSDALVEAIAHFVGAGGHVIAFGQAGRSLAGALSADVETVGFPAGGPVHAPGALLRLVPARDHPISLGLDRAIPTLLQRDGVFQVTTDATDTRVLGRFAGRDTVMSGWMSDPGAVRDAPAIVEVRHGEGQLHAFAFRPLFRAQTLVTAPLVHNLIYTMEMPSCPPHAPAKTNAGPTSDRTS